MKAPIESSTITIAPRTSLQRNSSRWSSTVISPMVALDALPNKLNMDMIFLGNVYWRKGNR